MPATPLDTPISLQPDNSKGSNCALLCSFYFLCESQHLLNISHSTRPHCNAAIELTTSEISVLMTGRRFCGPWFADGFASTGQWYLPDSGDSRCVNGGAVVRQHPSYMPSESMAPQANYRYGGYNEYPRRRRGGESSGFSTFSQWSDHRPTGSRNYHTADLAVRGCDLDEDWCYNTDHQGRVNAGRWAEPGDGTPALGTT